MKKREAIWELEMIGLNVPEVLHYQDKNPTEEQNLLLTSILHSAQRSNTKLSIRTERDGEFKSPFLPNASVPDVRKFLTTFDHSLYSIMVCKGLPTNSIIRGNCVPSSAFNTIEYRTGNGTVRDIDEAGRTPSHIRLPWGMAPPGVAGEVSSAIQLLNSFLCPKRFDVLNRIVEFSVFKKPVGLRHDKVIFWEVREYGGSTRA
jgi:hypothetical protein